MISFCFILFCAVVCRPSPDWDALQMVERALGPAATHPYQIFHRNNGGFILFPSHDLTCLGLWYCIFFGALVAHML